MKTIGLVVIIIRNGFLEKKMSRFRKRRIAVNKTYKDEQIFESRGVEKVKQYTTPSYKSPTDEDLLRIPYVSHYWSVGDRYFKLAQQHYNDHKLWYLIALFNRKPTESHIEVGEEIKIPTDIVLAMEILE
jgi:hypothetical protein